MEPFIQNYSNQSYYEIILDDKKIEIHFPYMRKNLISKTDKNFKNKERLYL